jgi:hypothetical protein
VGDEWATLWPASNFTTPGPPTLLCRDRSRFHCDGLVLYWAFASHDGRAIAADVADQFLAKRLLDQGFMNALRQTGF